MERDGFIISNWDVSGSGPAKRFYRITDMGLEYLNDSIDRLRKVVPIISNISIIFEKAIEMSKMMMSLLLLFLFIISALSGMVLFMKGIVDIHRDQRYMEYMHIATSLIFILVSTIHIYLNKHSIIYEKNRVS